MTTATFKIHRGDKTGGEFQEYSTGITEGMVVLDAIFTKFRLRVPMILPFVGTAKLVNAVPAQPKSTGCQS